MSNIEIIEEDITAAKVDAIVNAANSRMLGGGGVDGAIHRAAGPSLLEECYKVPEINGIRCPVGEARITSAGNLSARYVIHTVGPVYNSDPASEIHLASAYRSSLSLAVDNGCKSVAFPAISCGVYGYPHNEAAKIAIETCSQQEFSDIEIHFYLFSHRSTEIWRSRYKAFLQKSEGN